MEHDAQDCGAVAPRRHPTRPSDAFTWVLSDGKKHFSFHLPRPFTPPLCHWAASQGTLPRLAWTSNPWRNPQTSNLRSFFLPGWSPQNPPGQSEEERNELSDLVQVSKKGVPRPCLLIPCSKQGQICPFPPAPPETATLSISPLFCIWPGSEKTMLVKTK